MVQIVVDTLSDVVDANDGVTSLREAITLANATAAADEIVFAGGLSGTITLTGGELSLSSDITINGDTNGDGAADITISGNDASRIFSTTGTGTDIDLESLTLTNGSGGAFGGALLVRSGSTLDLINSTISQSEAEFGGAIASAGTLTVIGSTLYGNYAGDSGGAVEVGSFSSATFINSTIYGNYADKDGGGISAAQNTTLTILSSTITNNSTGGDGGGIELLTDSRLTIVNSVVADNTAVATGPDLAETGGGGRIDATNTFFGVAVNINVDNGGNVNGGGDPGLGTLADNGGPVQTVALLPGSALVGAGSVAALPADTFDLDGDGNTAEPLSLGANGLARISGGSLDIGAVQTQYALVVDTLSDVVDGDYSAGNLSLREAIGLVGAGGTISFADGLSGTITLTGGELSLSNDVTIDGDTNGDGAADITISGNNSSRIFSITGGGTDVDLVSLTLVDGRSDFAAGAAVFSTAGTSLDLVASTISGNTAFSGGGIFSNGTLSVISSTITGNSANYGAGVVVGLNSSATFINATVVGNDTLYSNGSAIHAFDNSTLNIYSSTILGSFAGGSQTALRVDDGSNTTIINSAVASAFSEPTANITAGASVFGDDVDIDNNILFGNITFSDFSLGALGNNGGPVQTMAPQVGSVLINSGDASALPADTFDIDGDGNTAEPLPLDASGLPRIQNGFLDIGAVEFSLPPVSDFDGNGVSDILMFNTATNQLGQFSMDGASSPTWRGIGTGGTGWEPAGTGDFDGDGDDDILWFNPTTGQVGQFEMTNNTASWAFIGVGGSGWEVAGVGDIGGDGTDDILWHNPTTGGVGQFEMSNGNETWRNIGVGAIGWDAVGLGDLDGDGDEDILWFNETTGGIGFFEMENGAPTWRGLGTGAAGWTVVGMGDFNGDGTDDILWFNETTRTLGQFEMDEGTPTWRGIGQAGIVASGWDPVSISDLNGDGTDDILLQQTSTGNVGQFRMDAGQPSWDFIATGAPGWVVVDPEDGGGLF